MSRVFRDRDGRGMARRVANKAKRRAAIAGGAVRSRKQRPSKIWDHNRGRMEGR